MNIKVEGSRRPSSGIKILNDERITPLPLPIMTSVPLAPQKQVSLSIAKSKSTSPPKKPQKQMDHYMLQTIKNEANEEGIEGETIDFILTDNNEALPDEGICGPSGEITEELHLSGDEDEEENTEEIVEHVCGKCFKSFRRLNGLKKHLDFCRFDSGYHLRKAEMLKNLEKIEKDGVIMENKDICFCCGESYDTFHLGHINCPDCPKSFKSQMSYERHIFITHSEFDDYPCTICNAKLRSDNLLKLHTDQHQNRGKPFACKICGKDFTRSYHLKRHQKYSSCSANEKDSMNCKVCNKAFFRLDNLRSHLKQHLGTHVTKKPEYMCPICKNCFYSLSTLNIHTRTHTGERPFDCDLCDKKFPSLVALKKHRRYHTGEKPYTCSVCNQSFAVKEVLNRHMKRHTGERPHVCSECGKSFIQATQLRSHSKTHVRPYECIECQERFKTEKQLQRHARTHNAKRRSIPRFQCDICHAPFHRESLLVKHMEVGDHSGKPDKKRKRAEECTKCFICEKNFDSNKSLQFHVLKVHEVNEEENANSNSSDDESVPLAKICKIEKEKSLSAEKAKIGTGSAKQAKVKNARAIAKHNKTETSTLTLTATSTSTSTTDEEFVATNETAIDSGAVVVKEFIVDEVHDMCVKETVMLQNEAFTIIPLDSVGDIIEPVTTSTLSAAVSNEEPTKGLRKSLAESLAAAIADENEEETLEVVEKPNEDDIKLKENVGKLLDMLVDSSTLKKFGWPQATEELVLCKVLENCGLDISKESRNYKDCDFATRMREYVKLLFTAVIHNDSIKELLNNYPIDEVIEYVLGNDDEEDDEEDEDGVAATSNATKTSTNSDHSGEKKKSS